MFWLKRLLKYLLYAVSGIALLITGFVVYLVWFQPPFYFPRPTGQYAIGVKDYHWIDTSRKETFASNPAHPYRELMVKVWYPAQGNLPEKPTTPYAPDLISFLKENQKALWLFGCSRPIYSYAQQNASIFQSNSPFPIIIFSHGHGPSAPELHTAHAEELASHGYVVVGINHSYGSFFTKFSDGRVIDGTASRKLRRAGSNFTQKKEQLDQELEVWVRDVQCVLDQLARLNDEQKDIFYQRLDQKNIGMFGHSLGGATAAQVCRRDSRVKAGVDLDGALFGPHATDNFNKPFMFLLNAGMVENLDKPLPKEIRDDFKITSQEEENTFKYLTGYSIIQLAKALGRDGFLIIIKNVGHLDFTDMALLKHASLFLQFFKNMGSKSIIGPLNGFMATEIVNAYLVNFFDKYLKGMPSALLDGKNKKYAEVEIR